MNPVRLDKRVPLPLQSWNVLILSYRRVIGLLVRLILGRYLRPVDLLLAGLVLRHRNGFLDHVPGFAIGHPVFRNGRGRLLCVGSRCRRGRDQPNWCEQ